jgi:broad specificity phosphatase PhoE
MIFNLPEHLLTAVNSLPPKGSAVLLLRHAEREAIVSGDDGIGVDLTPLGYARSFALGKHLGKRLLWAYSSPVLRAMNTLEQIIKGAGVTDLPLREDNLLGNPGPFVFDSNKGKQLFVTLGTECLVKKFVTGDHFEGIRSVQAGTQIFTNHLKTLLHSEEGLGIMVSHDAILIPLLAAWTGECFLDKWLDPLDGALIVADYQNKLFIHRNGNFLELSKC